jgi:hypothetical protein
MTKEQAQEIARRELERLFYGSEVQWVILDEYVQENQFGWLFFYDSRKYLETRNFSDRLVGNSPILVDRWSRIHYIGTAAPPDILIKELNQEGAFNPPTEGEKR